MNGSKGSTLHIKALEAGVFVRRSGCVLPLKLQDAADEIVKNQSITKVPVKSQTSLNTPLLQCWTFRLLFYLQSVIKSFPNETF